MALYVRYSLSCSSDFCTLYVLMYSYCTTTVSTSTKNPKISKKAKKNPKKPKNSQKICQNFAKKAKICQKAKFLQKNQKNQKKTKFSKNGLLCSLHGVCYLHCLLGLLGLTGCSRNVMGRVLTHPVKMSCYCTTPPCYAGCTSVRQRCESATIFAKGQISSFIGGCEV
jgi:hypothetical protein